MGDIKNPKLIIIKGFLFLFLGLLASTLLIMQAPRFSVVALLAVSVWAFCRFYYFSFYVLEHYVDDQHRYSGVFAAVQFSIKRLFQSRSARQD